MYRQWFPSTTLFFKNTHKKNCVNLSDDKGKHPVVVPSKIKYALLKCWYFLILDNIRQNK